MGSSTERSASLNITGLLGIAFVVLKLCEVIDWSWWWVTLPFWGLPALVVAIVGVGAALAGAVHLIAWMVRQPNSKGDRRDV